MRRKASRQAAGVLLAVAASCAVEARAVERSAYDWITGYTSTNAVVWDKHFDALADSVTPPFHRAPGDSPPLLVDRFKRGLGGPPDPVALVDDRYIVIGACVPHDCGSKSQLWIDPVDHVLVGVVAEVAYGTSGGPRDTSVIVFSRSTRCAQLPGAFRQELATWLSSIEARVTDARFVDRAGHVDADCLADLDDRRTPPPR